MDKILAANSSTSSAQNAKTATSQWEKEIDELVYRLYNLTYEEVKIIDPNIEKIISKADYERKENI